MYVHDKASAGFDSISQKLKGLDADTQRSGKSMQNHGSIMRDVDRAAQDLASRWENLAGESRNLGKEVDKNNKQLDDNADKSKKAKVAADGLSVSMRGLKYAIIGIALAPLLAGLADLIGLLVALGSAVAVAAAGLGGALVGAIGAAVPVVGLLVVAFKQLYDVIKLASDQQANAIQLSKDASKRSLEHTQQLYAEKQAHLAVTDAQKQLIIARRDAIRQIQDLNNAEKEAILTSQRATLGLIGSKNALAGLVSGGGSALDIANAQLDVSDAQQNIPQTQLQLGRAQQDAARARRQGVGGNPQVVSAQRSLSDAQTQLILQQKQFAQANKDSAAATADLTRRVNLLTPAEKGLLAAIVALKKEFKTDWKGITDPIINAFTGVVQGITKTLKDPQIRAAFKDLAGATGQFVTKSTNFFFTPQAKAEFLALIKGAKTDLPLVAGILQSIERIFGDIAVAAQPFVTKILKGIDGFLGSISDKTKDKKGLADFFANAEKAGGAILGIVEGLWGVLYALGSNGAFTVGVALLKDLSGYLKGVSDTLNDNGPKVQTFFSDVQRATEGLGGLISDVILDLLKIEKTGAFDGLVKILKYDVLPDLTIILVYLGRFLSWFGNISQKYPIIGQLSILFLGVGIAILKLIPLLEGLPALIKLIGAAADLAFGPEGLIIIGIIGLIAAIILLNDKFHFLGPTFDWLKNAAHTVIEYIKENWKGLLVALTIITGGLSLLVLEIINHWDQIHTAAVKLKNLLAPIFDAIVKYILAPLYKDGIKPFLDGLNDIIHFFDQNDLVDIIGGVFDKVLVAVNKVVGAFRTAYGILQNIATLGGIIGGGGTGNVAPGGGGKHSFGGAGGGTGGGSGGFQASLGRNPLQQGGGGSTGAGFLSSTGAILPGAASGVLKTSNSGQEDITPKTASGDPKKTLTLAQRAQAIADLMDNIPRTDSKGNKIRGYPYAWGGGHGSLGVPNLASGGDKNKTTGNYEVGFDCSGAVSAVLGSIGALSAPLDSTGFESWGVPAKGGEPIVVYANRTHAFMVINGVTYSTGSAQQDNGFGRQDHTTQGFVARTIPGFAGGGMIPGPTDTVPAMLTPGEMVLNKAHQMMLGGTNYLKKRLGFSQSGIVPEFKPGTVVSSSGGRDDSQGIIAHTDLQTAIATGIKVSVWDALDEVALGFKNALGKNSKGYTLMTDALTALDTLFQNQARQLTNLVAAQKSKLINSRYKVSGASGNTSVVDTGSDLTDAQKNLTNLGFDRDSVLGQLNDTSSTISQLQSELKKTPNNKANKDKRELLIGSIKNYQNQQISLQSTLDQNTIDLVNAQAAFIQAQVDAATRSGTLVANSADLQISIAQLTGIGKNLIPGLIQAKIAALVGEQGPLQNALAQAQASGNQALADSITAQLQDIQGQIAQFTEDQFTAISDAVDQQAQLQNNATAIKGRLAALGGNSFNSLNAQTGVLRQAGSDLRSQISAQYGLLAQATNPADALKVQQQIDELTTQLAENTDALRDNAEQIAQAVEDQTNNLASFKGGINSGVGGLIQSIAGLTQQYDLPGYVKSLSNQGQNLQSQGQSLRQQLSSQFGVQLSSDPNQLVQQLNSTDFGALEFGMDDNTKALFESLINGIVSNATAVVDNTSALNTANGQLNEQDWSSSLWTNFRDALFTGNGQTLAGGSSYTPPAVTMPPSIASSASSVSGGIIPTTPGTVVPGKVVTQGTNAINISVDNRGSGDVDTLGLAKRIAFEQKTR